ncbi:MAG: hypothetical protein ACO2ZS_00935 [Burkholderiaceae bacterium]
MTTQHLPTPASLPDAAGRAMARGQPLVLLVSVRGCTACEWVRRAVLWPAKNRNELVAVEIDMTDERRTLLGFDGQRRTPRTLAKGWGIRLAPTVLFLSAQGQELAERLTGLPLMDFYQAYFDQRLQQATRQLQTGRVGGGQTRSLNLNPYGLT